MYIKIYMFQKTLFVTITLKPDRAKFMAILKKTNNKHVHLPKQVFTSKRIKINRLVVFRK